VLQTGWKNPGRNIARSYPASAGAGTSKQVSPDGGHVSTVMAGVMAGAWAVTDRGILFLVERPMLDTSSRPNTVALYEGATGHVRRLGDLAFRVAPFGTTRYLAASQDGQWLLASHVDRWERDIIVIDNFR
jgi:hypothetical protein